MIDVTQAEHASGFLAEEFPELQDGMTLQRVDLVMILAAYAARMDAVA